MKLITSLERMTTKQKLLEDITAAKKATVKNIENLEKLLENVPDKFKITESLNTLIKDIKEIPDGDVDRYLIIDEIKKIIKTI